MNEFVYCTYIYILIKQLISAVKIMHVVAIMIYWYIIHWYKYVKFV